MDVRRPYGQRTAVIVIAAAVAAAASSILGSSAAEAATVTPWPQLLGGPAHTGFSSETAFTSASLSTVHENWSRPLSPGAGGGAVVVAGNVYTAGRALESYTAAGARRWTYALPNDEAAVSTSPAVVGGAALAVTCPDMVGEPSILVSLSATTGKLNWSRKLPGQSNSAPTVSAGVVYTLDRTASSGVMHLSAFTLRGGKLKWRAVLPSVGDATYSNVAVASGFAVVDVDGKTLSALQASTGAPVWSNSYDTGGTTFGSAMIAGGAVYVSTGATVVAVNLSSGAQLWQRTDLGGQALWLAGDPGRRLLFATMDPGSGPDYFVAALDMGDGTTHWSRVVPDAGSSTLAAGILYVGQVFGSRFAVGFYDEASGLPVRTPVHLPRAALAGPGYPVIANRHIYVIQGGYSRLTSLGL